MKSRTSTVASAIGLALALSYAANGAILLRQLPSVPELHALAQEPSLDMRLSPANQANKAAVLLARCVERGETLVRQMAMVVATQRESIAHSAKVQLFAGLVFASVFGVSLLAGIRVSRSRVER